MKRLYISIILLIIGLYNTQAQYTTNPSENSIHCPNQTLQFELTDLAEGCQVSNFTIKEGGTLVEKVSETKLEVKTLEKDTLRLSFILNNCTNTDYNRLHIAEYAILSLAEKSPKFFESSYTSIEFQENPTAKTYRLKEMEHNDGTPVYNYEWNVPSGWTINGIVSDGNVWLENTDVVSIIPTQATEGYIKVKANNEWCTDAAQSQTEELYVSRHFPENTAVYHPGQSQRAYGNRDLIKFEVPYWTFATYSWNTPPLESDRREHYRQYGHAQARRL